MNETGRVRGKDATGHTDAVSTGVGGDPGRGPPTSSTATSCPLRSSRNVSGCLESSPGITVQPRRGMEAMWVFRSVRSLWRTSLLPRTLHQRSRQRLLDSTFRYPEGDKSQAQRPGNRRGEGPGR